MIVLSWEQAVLSVGGDLHTAFGWESEDYYLYVAYPVDPLIDGEYSDAYMIHKASGVVEKQPLMPGTTDQEWELIHRFDGEMRKCHTKWPSGMTYDPLEDFGD